MYAEQIQPLNIILQKVINNMCLTEYPNLHDDWVKQVYYHTSKPYIISCSRSSQSSLVIVDWSESRRPKYTFRVPKGVSVFTVIECKFLFISNQVL